MTDTNLDRTEPPHLAEMLSIDPSRSQPWRPEELAAVLRHQLDTPIEFEVGRMDEVPPDVAATITFGDLFRRDGAIGALGAHGAHGAHGAPILLALLERAKRFAKACKSRTDGPLPVEVATALYFACIVAALLRCNGARISALDDRSLLDGVQWALAQPWLSPEIRELLNEASTALRSK
jgi:hypothetical protein